MRPGWRGIFPALSTPTNDKGELDEGSLRSEIRFNISWGAHGLCPSIVAGEFYKFTDEERKRIFETVVDEANGRVPVLTGVHHSGTEPSVIFGRYAEDIGADGIIIMAPYYGRITNQDVLYTHFSTVAKKVDLPIMIQDTGMDTNISPIIFQNLSEEFSNISSVKVEGYGTLEKIVELKELLGDRLIIFGGMAGRLILQEFTLGAEGNIPGACLTDLLTDVYNNLIAGNIEKAKMAFSKYKVWLEFFRNFPSAFAEIEKETLRLRGVIKTSQTRGPNVPLREKDKTNLKEILVGIGVVSNNDR